MFTHPPFLYARPDQYAELVFFDKPEVMTWEVSVDNTIDNAFATPTAQLTVPKVSGYRSQTIRRNGWGRTQYHDRNRTRAFIHWDDVWAAGSTQPHNSQPGYLRVREIYHSGTTSAWSPILIIPPPGFFSSPRPSLTIRATAPNVALPADGLPPAGALHLMLPRFSDWLAVSTTSATGLYVATKDNMSMQTLGGNSELAFYDGVTTELLLIGNGGTATFDVRAAIVNGEMA